MNFPEWQHQEYQEPQPPYPGSAFSLCHHGPPSRQYRDCEICQDAARAWRERADAWLELSWLLWLLDCLFAFARPTTPPAPSDTLAR